MRPKVEQGPHQLFLFIDRQSSAADELEGDVDDVVAKRIRKDDFAIFVASNLAQPR
jgi:hypothetical protein